MLRNLASVVLVSPREASDAVSVLAPAGYVPVIAACNPLEGRCGSLYIDSVIFRDVDDLRLDGSGDPLPRGAGWADDAATDGTPETREYLLQNWRADVVAVYASNGTPFEHIRYSPYGVPTGIEMLNETESVH